jgi:hypothetical protein
MHQTARALAAMAIALSVATPFDIAARDLPPPPAPLEERMVMRVEGLVAVDANGLVVGHKLFTKLPDALRTKLEHAMATWQFAPVAVPKGARDVVVAMQLTLGATKTEGGHALRLEEAAFADAQGHFVSRERVAIRSIIRSPYEETNAIVDLAARVDADGQAVEIATLRCTLFNAGGDAEEKALMCRRLEAIATESTQLTHFKKTNMTLPGVTDMRMQFLHAGPMDERDGVWRIESRTPERTIAWLPAPKGTPLVALKDGIVGAPL